jgi:protein O-GlcNAc transferase
VSATNSILEQAVEHYHAGRREQAQAALRRVLQKDPLHAGACNLMALTLLRPATLEQAEYYARRAVELLPAIGTFRSTLGMVLEQRMDGEGAVAQFREATRLDPGSAASWNNLGNALTNRARFGEAAAAYEQSLRLEPEQADGRMNYALLIMMRGETDRAAQMLEEAIAEHGEQPRLLSALCCVSNYAQDYGLARTLAAHRRYGSAVAAALPPPHRPFAAAPADRDRILRVGYLSPDFREHSVAAFIEPILAHHDRARFDACCYSTSPLTDAVTARLRSHAALWRDAHAMDDATLAELIRRDRIDILVELTGHTTNSRLPVLARRPAPVQATYLGYPNTTGLETADWRIVDAVTDPPGAEAFAVERLARVEACFLCYRPPPDAPEPGPPPSERAGSVTFGSFNAASKIGARTARLWAGVLRAVPGSRLLLKAAGLDDPWVRGHLESMMSAEGVEPGRIEWIGYAPSKAAHLALYGRMDIALDTLPYNGTTTTCEALWMGVPVVTLEGEVGRHAARVGSSLLRAAGLTELVATDDAGFARITASLATDPPRLRAVRSSLRGRLRASTLCDEPGFTRRLETTYRAMWAHRCEPARQA